MGGELVRSSSARILEEFYKILRQGRSRETFEMLHDYGLLAYLLPDADRDRPVAGELRTEEMLINMGPHHPSTHGVLRIVLELDGEIITKAMPDLGYLHRGDEKIAENMTYTQFIPYTDRLDYLAPLANNVAYALAVEKLLGIDKQLPPRCQFIRVICAELARISSHLLGVGCYAMDVGAMTVFFWTFREREILLDMFEKLCGARLTLNYYRIGGVDSDFTPDLVLRLKTFLDTFPEKVKEYDSLIA